MKSRDAVYDLIEAAVDDVMVIEQACLGLTWTSCRSGNAIGFAQSPGIASRVLSFPGSLAGRTAAELATWLRSWDPFEATVGLSAANVAINTMDNPLMRQAVRLEAGDTPANLVVFEHFRARLERKKVVVIGRYPGLDHVLQGLDVTVLERHPGADDLPDPAAEFVIPQADWVFLTATSLINKTFPRLLELARDAVTVLMGPSAPWLPQLSAFGIDFLAGVVPLDVERAASLVAEGAGTRLFGDGVVYAVADIGTEKLTALKSEIAETAKQRTRLKEAMEAWYTAGNPGRFPGYAELEGVSDCLSGLDTRFKRLWDARQSGLADG